MIQDERLEVANNAYFHLIDTLNRQAARNSNPAFHHHSIEKIQGLLYLWTAPDRGFMPFAHLLEFPEEEISTICFIPEQTQTRSDNYYQELQLANRFYTGAKRQLDEAIRHYRQALAERTTIECLNNIGCALLESKRLREAKSHFVSATALAPKAHEPYHNLAHTQIKIALSEGLAETDLREQTMSSIRLYKESLRLNPENHFAWHNIGNLHTAREDYLSAINSYCQALSLSPKYASSMCALAHCYRSIKDYGKAFETLLPLLNRNNSYSFLITLANLLVESSTVTNIGINAQCAAGFSEFFKSKTFFKLTLRKRLQLVRPLYEQALRMKATSSSALAGLGNLKLLMGDYEQALECYKKAIYFNSRCIAAHNGGALAFYCMRNYQLAVIKFQDSLRISRNRLSTLLGSLVARRRLKQTAQACHIAEELFLLYPENQLIYYYHSLLLEGQASRQDQIKEGLTKKPSYPNNGNLSYKIIGELMLQFGRLEEAVDYFRYAKDEFLLRRYHQQSKEPQQAVDAYIKVLEQNRDDDEALFRIAEICFSFGLLQSCQAVLAELMKTDEENSKFLCLLARVKSQQKKHGEEVILWQQIVGITGEAEDALNCLALAHLKQGSLYEASRYVRLALKKDPRNWAVLNNLANISRETEKHEEARHYYRESQLAGPECFVPFVNSAGLLPLYEAFPPAASAVEAFNVCLHFLFCDQYNPCFSEILKLAGKVSDEDYMQIISSIAILSQQFPPFIQYGRLCKFLLSSFCNQSPLLDLQRLLGLSESLDGFADAMQSMNYPCDGEAVCEILCLLVKQAFVANQQEALLANDRLCRKHQQFFAYSKRQELIFWAQSQVAKRIELLFQIIDSLLCNKGKAVTQSSIRKLFLEEMYSGIRTAEKIKTLIEENEQIQQGQIEQVISEVFLIVRAKHIHYYQDFSLILAIIEHEQATLVDDLKQSSKEQKTDVFLSYYKSSYFVNLFIKYALHQNAHFIEPHLRRDLAKAFLEAKTSSRGTVQVLRMVMKEMSLRESVSNQSTASSLRLSMEYEEKRKALMHSEESINAKAVMLKETNYQRETKEARIFSKLSIVLASTINTRSAFQKTQIGPQSDHSVLRNCIESNFEYESFNLSFCKTRQLCQQYISKHPSEHLDSSQTLMKTENALSYQQMLELGHKEVFRFIWHLSSAIIQLEEHGIYHCHLSLKNVIRLEDTFKIIDFDFVLMLENKDGKFFEATKYLVSLWFNAQTKQIQQTVVRYIFRNPDLAIEDCLLGLRDDKGEPREKIDSFLAKLKEHAIGYYRRLFGEIINGIVDANQKDPKLFTDEIRIITEYLNQLAKQPHAFKQSLEAFRKQCRSFYEQNSMLEDQ